MISKKVLLFGVIISGIVYCEGQNSQANDFIVSHLPKDTLNDEQLKEVQGKVLQSFKEKCEKNGGSNAYANAEIAFKHLSTCIEGLVDPNVLKAEMDQASPNGQLDEVFKKYCAKTPAFKECLNNALAAARPCLAADERANLNTVQNVTDQLAEFICYKQGDRIALFIAEGGMDCFTSQQESLQQCFNSTFGEGQQLDFNNLTVDNIPKLVFEKEECSKVSALQACAVAVLDHCPQPTTANIVDSLFNFVQKATPCRDLVPDEPSGAGGALVLSVVAAAAAAGVAALLM